MCVHLNVQGSHDKIIITIVPSYTGKNYRLFVAVALLLVLHTRKHTDSKLMIFSSTALYYGDTYIAFLQVM